MGIYDRDYYREDRPEPGVPQRAAGWMGTWSVNTWIIALCVAVFVLDKYFLPISLWRPVLIQMEGPVALEVVGGAQYREVQVGPENQSLLFQRRIDDVARGIEGVGTATYEWMPPLQHWLHFSTMLAFGHFELWRFIGFQFLHASMSHLLFNMLGLYFFGGMVEAYLGSKRYLAFYLLCGIFGALMYLLLNLLGVTAEVVTHQGVKIPGLLFSSTATPLVGASAGIFGVLMAGAYLAPTAVVLLFYVIPMQLRTLAYALIVLALYTVITGGANAGGEAGHLGGAIAGYFFIRRPHHLHGFFDFLGRVDPTSHHYRPGRPRSGQWRRTPGAVPRAEGTGSGDPEINRILDKIKTSGIASLSDDEKRALNEASRRGR
jgi:membrane associated rhomboid family serine protease